MPYDAPASSSKTDTSEMDALYGEGKPGETTPQSIDQENAEKSAESPTSLVSMKVLMGPDGVEPDEGDEIVVKVVKKHGDQASIMYAPAKKKEGVDAEKKEMGADEELDALSTEDKSYG